MTTTWSCLIILCFMEDVSKRPRNFLSLSELGYMWLFIGILLQESSPTFDKVSELVTKLAYCYMTLFHNFRPRVLRQEPWPSRFHLPALWKPPDFGIWFPYRAQNSKSGFSQSNQVLLLTTPENTITYRNTVCWSLCQNFAYALFFSFSWGHLTPKRNWRQCLCKILAEWPTNRARFLKGRLAST